MKRHKQQQLKEIREKIRNSTFIQYASAHVVRRGDEVEVQIINGIPEIKHTVDFSGGGFSLDGDDRIKYAYAVFSLHDGTRDVFRVQANGKRSTTQLRIDVLNKGLEEIPYE